MTFFSILEPIKIYSLHDNGGIAELHVLWAHPQGLLLWDLDNEENGWDSRKKWNAPNVGTYLNCILYEKS